MNYNEMLSKAYLDYNGGRGKSFEDFKAGFDSVFKRITETKVSHYIEREILLLHPEYTRAEVDTLLEHRLVEGLRKVVITDEIPDTYDGLRTLKITKKVFAVKVDL